MTTETPAGEAAPATAYAQAPRTQRFTALAVFAAALLAYLLNGDFLPGNDATPNVELPYNVLEHGRLTFSPRDWPGMFLPAQPGAADARPQPLYYVTASTRLDAEGDPLYVSSYGVGAGLTALPVYWVARAIGVDLRVVRTRWYLGKIAASLCAAAAVALFYLIAARHLPHGGALWVTAAFGLGTCLWSSSSQTLGQHGPSALFLLLGTWCLLNHRDSAAHAAAAGAAYAWAVFCRPTGVIPLAIAGLYLLLTQRRLVLAYAAGAAPLVLALAAYNAYYLGSPLTFGQLAIARQVAAYATGTPDVWATPFWTGVAGQLWSPSRGLLVFSPIFLAAFVGLAIAWRSREHVAFRMISVAALVLLLFDAKWFSWWGGWSYGYRLKAEAAMLLALLLIPAMPAILRRRPARLAFLLLLAWSIGVQWLGAFAYDLRGWNARVLGYRVAVPGETEAQIWTPEQVRRAAEHPGVRVLAALHGDVDQPAFRRRLWSLTDSQILYYATHYAESRALKQEVMRAQWE